MDGRTLTDFMHMRGLKISSLGRVVRILPFHVFSYNPEGVYQLEFLKVSFVLWFVFSVFFSYLYFLPIVHYFSVSFIFVFYIGILYNP